MTYAQYGKVEALDYNTLVGNTTPSTPNTFNATWSTGSGTTGYGQVALTKVATGAIVDDATWNNLVTKSANVASHQGTVGYTTITAPTEGDTITYLNPLPTNLQLIYSQRLNAALQGSTISNTITTTQTWINRAYWTHTVTFASGDSARYFFNSGGQIKMTCSHPAGSGINNLLNNLASSTGTVTISSITAGTINISGTSYNGVTQIPTTGYANTIYDITKGYYGLSTSNASIFYQTAVGFGGGPVNYLNTNINYIARTNGPQGVNGDTGSVITIYTNWNELPSGLTAASGSTVTCTVQLPETTYIANTWGAINISGVVTVS